MEDAAARGSALLLIQSSKQEGATPSLGKKEAAAS
jgi:hypothetical protein